MSESSIPLSENDLKELFSLFTSPTEFEREQIYSPRGELYFLNQDISEEYSLTEEKREYALDAWRSVLYFLYKRGYSLCRNGKETSLAFISEEFIQ
ncbi:MAG: hypothetical protein QOF61_3375 [Acidobacteriota bacterium]|jgi:hypothetical protein|nr:hypothetical protein [Acidobacteriota bacterium]